MSNFTQKWVKVLLPFTSGYNNRYTGTELAGISKIPQQTASRYLAVQAKNGMLSFEKQGKNKLYYIDLSRPVSYALLQNLENHKAIEFQQRVKDMAVIIHELLSCAEAIILFGSYSKYTFDKNSDLDIVVLGKADKGKIRAIKQKYHIQISEHYSTYEEFRDSLKSRNPLAIEISENHIIFGNCSKVVSIFIEACR